MGLEKRPYIDLFIIKEIKIKKRINTDEMVARIGSWKDNNLQIRCARGL